MFGLAQQLRGAHFLSHDITTLVLCLLCARCCFMLTGNLTAQSVNRVG